MVRFPLLQRFPFPQRFLQCHVKGHCGFRLEWERPDITASSVHSDVCLKRVLHAGEMTGEGKDEEHQREREGRLGRVSFQS